MSGAEPEPSENHNTVYTVPSKDPVSASESLLRMNSFPGDTGVLVSQDSDLNPHSGLHWDPGKLKTRKPFWL